MGAIVPDRPKPSNSRDKSRRRPRAEALTRTLTIDTLAVSELLQKRGFSADQASGIVQTLQEIDAQALATKNDLRVGETEIVAKIETTAANLKVEILRWLVVTQVALGGFIAALVKLGH